MGVPRLDVETAERGIRAGDRTVLARAITLIESARPEDRALQVELVERLLPLSGKAVRVGITGVPGVGKSTFVDALGAMLLDQGKRVAVLAVDPSSLTSGGSILGDKTRMPRLAADARAYVRPSPTSGELGGVTRTTAEARLLCEAFGFDVVVIETVGVGQSETTVTDLVDTFVVLALAGAGDELQGIKKGLMEHVDIVAVNKADGDNVTRARRAARDLGAALRLQRRRVPAWEPVVLTTSAKLGTGVSAVWDAVIDHRRTLEATDALEGTRQAQSLRWMARLVDEGILARFRADSDVRAQASKVEADVAQGRMTPARAAESIVAAFSSRARGG